MTSPARDAALTPLHKSITVNADQKSAFRRFTTEMTSWWPLQSHSVGQANTERVVFEGRVGGRIHEVFRNGGESVWGTVKVWDPPSRVAFTWHPGDAPDTAQLIEVKFIAQGNQTRVELTHSGWEALGDRARIARRGYPIGWAYVLRIYAGKRWSPVVILLSGLTWVMMGVSSLKRPAGAAGAAG